MTKNADTDKYGYSGYGIGFDRRTGFSIPGGGFGQNVLIFGTDMSFSTHIHNKKKDILVLGKLDLMVMFIILVLIMMLLMLMILLTFRNIWWKKK